jgi:sulfide:quinone oxidoreductase
LADIRHVTPRFAVAPQLTEADFAEIAAAGFKSVINNRPDGEAPDQIADAKAREAAKAAGLDYQAIPFAGPPGPAQVEATVKALEALPGPVLAYCRSGTRSITAWALAQAQAKARGSDEIIGLAQAAGYDLSALKPRLDV